MIIYAKKGYLVASKIISRFWFSRICDGTVFLSLLVVALFIVTNFLPNKPSLFVTQEIPAFVAIYAVILGVSAVALRMWTPSNKETTLGQTLYLLSAVLTLLVNIASPEPISLLFGLWLLIATFAGYFGFQITGIMTILLAILSSYLWIDGKASLAQAVQLFGLGVTPLILGLIMWRGQTEEKKQKTYQDVVHNLGATKNRSDIVINSIDDGVITISQDGVIELINPSAQQMLGWQEKDAMGLNWQSILKFLTLDGKDVADVDNPVNQALETKNPIHSDKFQLLTNSGKRLLIYLVCTPLGGQGGGGQIIVFRDITKEKAEEREQAEFISTASHEMRTPVASIEGYLGLALNPATATIDDKARDFITKAHASAEHLGRLFQDLLDISKADDGRLKSQPEVLDVTSFVEEIFQGLAHKAKEKNLHYIFKPRPDIEKGDERYIGPIFYVDVDPDHFREVTANLIENAIKYTLSGSVVVDILGDEKNVTVSVQDSGIGIPAEDLPHLFQKFYRVDNTDTREIGGTGLGLYLSRRLAESMSGHLRVESEYKKGSTFFLDVPRISHEEAMRKINDLSRKLPEIVKESRPTLDTDELSANSGISLVESEPLTIPQPRITPQPMQQTPEIALPQPIEQQMPSDFIPPQPQPVQAQPNNGPSPNLTPQQSQQTTRQGWPQATIDQLHQLAKQSERQVQTRPNLSLSDIEQRVQDQRRQIKAQDRHLT